MGFGGGGFNRNNNPFGGSGFGGGFPNPFANRRNGKRRVSPLTITFIVLFILSSVLVSLSGFYADLLWYRSVGFVGVCTAVQVGGPGAVFWMWVCVCVCVFVSMCSYRDWETDRKSVV